MKIIGMLLLLALLITNTYANESKKELALEFIKLSNMEQSMNNTLSTYIHEMKKGYPDMNETKLREYVYSSMGWDVMKKPILDIIMRHFSAQQLKDVIDFYNTPSGKAFSTERPKISIELSKLVTKNFMQTFRNLKDQSFTLTKK